MRESPLWATARPLQEKRARVSHRKQSRGPVDHLTITPSRQRAERH